MSLRSNFPLRLLINGENCTYLLDNGFTFSNVDPGGFEMASFPIPRDMPEIVTGLPVRLECGTQVAWEGRVSEVQRSLGNHTLVTCEGNAARFKDQSAAMIFVDRDLTQWQGPTLANQIRWVTGGFTPESPQVAADPSGGNPALAVLFSGPWAAGGLPACDATYDSRGIPLGDVFYEWGNLTGGIAGNGNWLFSVKLTTDDVLTAGDTTANLNTGPASGGGTLAATVGNRVFAILELLTVTAGGTANVIYGLYWTNLAVYGNHGLPTQAITGGFGFYPSQIAGWVESRVSGVQLGNIQLTDASGYIAPHIVYYDPVTLDTMLNDMARLNAWHWGVWESPTYLLGNPAPRLDFQPRPSPGTWDAWAWRQECDVLDLREDLTGQYDTAVIQYSTVDGLDRSVTVTLDNPYLDRSGIGRGAGGPGRTVVLNGGTMTPAAASSFAEIALALLQDQARVAGQITITTAIHDATGAPMPAWMLRAGEHRIRIPDLPSVDYLGAQNDLPIARVECSVSEQGFSTSVEVGQAANLVETLQARLSAAASLAGQGG